MSDIPTLTARPDRDSPLTLLLRPREAAAALAISPRTLWTLAERGELRAVRIGRAVCYSVDELRAFISRRMEGGSHVAQ